MPELPDLVHVEAGLRAALAGKRIAAARTGDPTVLRVMVTQPFPDVLVGRRLDSIDRRGHFMRFGLEGDLVIVVNAMLVGRYKLIGAGATTEKAKKDPRSLGLALTFDDAPELQYLDEKRMGKAAARRRDQVRAFVMDKRALASVGNAYADEILFAARLHPKTFCNKLDAVALDALYAAIGHVLRDAIGEIRRRDEPIDVKVRDFLKVRGRDGKPCLVCGTTIRAVRVGDGDACFCPSCQPETRKLFINWSASAHTGRSRPPSRR